MSTADGLAPFVMGATEARRCFDEMKAHVGPLYELYMRVWRGRGWLALGYASWDEACTAEFAGIRPALDREQRREAVAELRGEGMSTRAIGSALGVADQTVRADLERVREVTQTPMPERVASLDGRERPASRPPRPASSVEREPAPEPEPVDVLSHPVVRDDQAVQAAEFRMHVLRAIGRAQDLLTFPAERTADLVDDVDVRLIESLAERLQEWSALVVRHRRGLRLVNGSDT